MEERKCPKCGLLSPPDAVHCNCGYHFQKGDVKLRFEHKFEGSLLVFIVLLLLYFPLAIIYWIHKSVLEEV